MIIVEYTPELIDEYTITLMASGDGDGDDSGEDDDWSDIDDEDFEDLAEDRDDLHEMEIDNNLFDEDDADHLPDDDME
jgi:hypothetical protein